LPTGDEKILFVDDEESLVKMAQRMPEMQGYQVEKRSDSVEALELFRSGPDRFDLIITDMTMPKMTGDNLAKEILSIRQEMPIILCSGFSDRIDVEKTAALGIRK
jgi:two-component system cell cycle sensor histidine kinase/response regulator CckA